MIEFICVAGCIMFVIVMVLFGIVVLMRIWRG